MTDGCGQPPRDDDMMSHVSGENVKREKGS